MIEASKLCKSYGVVDALADVSFEIPANQVVGLLGPNGAGKTTLMKLLTGFLHPTAGSARVAGQDVVERPLQVQQRIGYLPENAPLYPEMLVQSYLELMASMRDVPASKRHSMIATAVRRTGLAKHLLRPIGQLSKGYRQRVGLAQAILHGPQVLILDEPTSGLDPNQIVEIRALIQELSQTATVLLSTHILSEVQLSCERVLIITEGRVRKDAMVSEMQSAGAAVVAVHDTVTPDKVRDALAGLAGVTDVERVEDDQANHYVAYRVTADDDDLCPRIYELARDGGWKLSELRREQRTLETVFRAVVEQGRVDA